MKRIALFTLVALLLITSIPLSIPFAANTSSQFSVFTYNGRDYLPLRLTFEKLGYQVSWQEDNQTATIESTNAQLMIRPSEPYFLKNGVLKLGKYAPVLINHKLYLPVANAAAIFETVSGPNKGLVTINSTLSKETVGLPKLKNALEYEKLMSFYPTRQIYYALREDAMAVPTADNAASESTSASSGSDKSDVSGTNNQVVGVDEADTMKTNGKYLFTVKDQEVQIFKLGRGDLGQHMTIKSDVFYPSQLFISENYLVVIGQETNYETKVEATQGRFDIMPVYRQQPLMVRFYDLKAIDNKEEKLVMSYGVAGNLVAARMVENYIYLIANQYTYYGPMALPAYYKQEGTGPVTERVFEANGLTYFPGQGTQDVLYTVGIDMNHLDASGLDVQSYLGGGYNAYATANSLYLAGAQYRGMWWRDTSSGSKSDLYAFDLNQGKITYRAKGSVQGNLLNQFSMDEYQDHFRVATTDWTYNELTQTSTTSNDLTIFDRNLTPVGSLNGLAPGETIYSTRFIDSKLYMVTYRQVDPFYVIDTANPTDPKVLGYLKIPGYSSYLHPYNANTIIGIGMETKEVGDRVVNAGVKISLFDVSDFANPIEKDKMIIGAGNSYSDVSWDHKAFLFNLSRNIMALPIMAESEQGLWSTKDAYIFDFTSTGMLHLKGKISHNTAPLPTITTNANGEQIVTYPENTDYWEEQVDRIFYVNKDLYTLSRKWLQVNDFDTLEAIKAIKH